MLPFVTHWGRRGRTLGLLACLAAAGPAAVVSGCTGPKSGLAERQAQAAAPSVSAMMPAVVLVLGTLPDGNYSFGSGLVLDDEGTVLTNMHVVAKASALGALFFDPARTTYNFQEGGLGRYLFEYEADIKRARLVRADPAVDLAILKVDANTRHLPKLPLRREPPVPGERVLALGHPGGAPWSFTAGIVSALPTGLIQHDATLDFGNSGGPLIDEAGQVLGINTSTLFKARVAYARPIALSSALLDAVAAPFVPDQSNPERALKTCIRAVELASPAFVECFDVRGLVDGAAAVLSRRLQVKLLSGRSLARSSGPLTAMSPQLVKDKIEAALRQRLLSSLGEADFTEMSKRISRHIGAKAEVAPDSHEWSERLLASGIKDDWRAPSARTNVLRMGTRVTERRDLSKDITALRVEGRNADRTAFSFVALMKRTTGKWRLILDEGVLDETQRRQIQDWPLVLGSEMLIGPLGTLSLELDTESDGLIAPARPETAHELRTGRSQG